MSSEKGKWMFALKGLLAAAAFFLLSIPQHALAQGLLSKPVRLLTPAPPGSASDLALRGIAEVLSEETGNSYFVENRPGANGFIATRACAHAAPDGHTFCLLSSVNVAFSPAVFNSMPYDSRADLVPVVLLGFFPAGLWANAKLPVDTADELFAMAKKNPGKLNLSTFGAASSSSVLIDWLRNVRGLDFTNIPYKSALDAYRGVVAGEADVTYFALGPAATNAKPGQVKLLAVDSPKRLPEHPDLPTFSEINVGAALGWFGFFAPRGTPPEIADRVNASIVKKLMNDPGRRKKFIDNGGIVLSEPAGGSRESFSKFVEDELTVFARIVDEAKMKKIDWK